APVTQTIALAAGDRLLLCSDGVTDPVPPKVLEKVLAHAAAPPTICQALVTAANAHGGPDNITAIVIDHQGLHDAPAPPAPKNVAASTPRGQAQALHDALTKLERDLAWLLNGTHELEGRSMLSAFAAVKRRLGPDVYQDMLQLHPSKNPTHVFH